MLDPTKTEPSRRLVQQWWSTRALLVLNAPFARLVTVLPTLRVTVPARRVFNQEPLLLEATLVQLGGEKIEKTLPKQVWNSSH